jgi:hypothetical protein
MYTRIWTNYGLIKKPPEGGFSNKTKSSSLFNCFDHVFDDLFRIAEDPHGFIQIHKYSVLLSLEGIVILGCVLHAYCRPIFKLNGFVIPNYCTI